MGWLRDDSTGEPQRGALNLVRPLLGAAAALALIVGGLLAFSYTTDPAEPQWRIQMPVVTKPWPAAQLPATTAVPPVVQLPADTVPPPPRRWLEGGK